MEKRMYFFVPYQLTGIQQGIQAGHVALEYAKTYSDDEDFIDFRDNWKTWVILNGGTTNKDPERLGSLNAIFRELVDNQINCEAFYEPDLGDQMTAVCFICDEHVFNKEEYSDEYRVSCYDTTYEDWIEIIGGYKNLFLRELLEGKKLA